MTETPQDDNRNIYLDNQGNYRDRTDENLAQYPPLDTGDGENAPEGVPATQPDTDAVPEEAPVPVAPEAEEPATAKTRKA